MEGERKKIIMESDCGEKERKSLWREKERKSSWREKERKSLYIERKTVIIERKKENHYKEREVQIF